MLKSEINVDGEVCRHHSGVHVRIDHVEFLAQQNRKEIDSMKKLVVGSLISIILTLIASIAILAIRISEAVHH